MKAMNECICFWVDEKLWTTHYGAVEPGSQMEWNPECPVHPPDAGGLTVVLDDGDLAAMNPEMSRRIIERNPGKIIESPRLT